MVRAAGAGTPHSDSTSLGRAMAISAIRRALKRGSDVSPACRELTFGRMVNLREAQPETLRNGGAAGSEGLRRRAVSAAKLARRRGGRHP